ncbi:tetratricopeptide repeat protein [Parvularcula marina]|uniref:Tetratricopeptide repeat protein n=1 Tax=Parvularcula marina TaxID=2292771 RepID=A0A371RK41_9PROT|nr:tetratricopeptide repeat protein [Parvularcula marina]RFB05825.1 hypothetical protein DX908_11440 [Parvularcula marina]
MRKHLSAAAIMALVGMGALPGATPFASTANAATAQSNQTPEEERRRARLSLSTSTARVLQEVFNDINSEPPNYAKAMDSLNRLLSRDGLSKFDESTSLELRAGIYAQQENYAAALRDFERILQLDELPFDRLKQIRYYVAQLYFTQERYADAIRFMELYLAEEGNVEDTNAWYILAAAYVSQGNYQKARRPAERALQYDEKKEKKSYDLLNLIYSELQLNAERGRLLEEMVERFPNEEGYWAQLSGSYDAAGRRKDALATLEAAYNAGLITDEDKIIALAQYYSSLDNPYRGAKLIEEEMAAGAVKRDLDNLTLLSQLWSMSREQDKAIEALSAAARISPSGELYYRLGQSYMASERFEEGIRALNEALERGGLSAQDRGDINLLLGNAYFQLDPDSADGRRRARRAFERALNSPRSRNSAQGWIAYIDAYERTLRQQAEIERIQRQERLQRERDRCDSLVDLADLGGAVNESDVSECRALIARTDEQGRPLDPNAASDEEEAAATEEEGEAADEEATDAG